MHSRGGSVDFQIIAEKCLDRFDQSGPAPTIDLTHFANVPSEMAECHEVGKERKQGFVLGYGSTPESQIQAAVKRFYSIVSVSAKFPSTVEL